MNLDRSRVGWQTKKRRKISKWPTDSNLILTSWVVNSLWTCHETWIHFIFSISLWKSLSAVRILEFIYSKTLVLQARKTHTHTHTHTLGNPLTRTTKPGGNRSEFIHCCSRWEQQWDQNSSDSFRICLLLKICPCPGNHLLFLSHLWHCCPFQFKFEIIKLMWLNRLLLFSHSVVSNSLRPHGLQHTRLPWLSPSPGVCSNSYPLRQWCHPTISSSVTPFSSCSQSFQASGS